jgi:hypothetical protein
VSEWAADQVATRLHLTNQAAQELLVLAVTLDERLPATLTALEHGRIGRRHAEALAELLPLLTAPSVRAQVETRLLARVGSKTHTQLRVTAGRAVLSAGANAALRRAAAAVQERGVRLHPGTDGTDALPLTHASPVARAATTRSSGTPTRVGPRATATCAACASTTTASRPPPPAGP